MINKKNYKQLCDVETSIPIYSQYWWLDTVCGIDNWDVVLIYNKEGNIIASLPYYIKKKYGFKRLSLPKLTQKLGPWIKYPKNQKYESKLSYEHKLLKELIENIPKFDEFYQKFDYKYTNCLAFYWNNFKQMVHYTYRINDLSNIDEVYNNFRGNIKGDIKKAKKNNIMINTNPDIELFYSINQLTFKRQNLKMPYSIDFIKKLDNNLKEKRKMYFAVDHNNQIHAAIYIIYDSNCVYYLMGGGDPNLRNSGATSLLMWNAIKDASSEVNSFDFEGSMIQPVERFCRGFGAEQTPYYSISKTNSKMLKCFSFVKEIIEKK